MDFEIIDESEIVTSRQTKMKKTKSLFDIPVEERNYWDKEKDDYLLLFLACRMRIRRYNKKGWVVNLDNDPNFIRLDYNDQQELRDYQRENVQGTEQE